MPEEHWAHCPVCSSTRWLKISFCYTLSQRKAII